MRTEGNNRSRRKYDAIAKNVPLIDTIISKGLANKLLQKLYVANDDDNMFVGHVVVSNHLTNFYFPMRILVPISLFVEDQTN